MKKVMISVLVIMTAILLTGCEALGGRSADTVSYNISREADEFKVKRRIVFINLRSDEYLLSVTGNCSIKGGLETDNNELEVICRIGEDKYQKHFFYIANETTYTVEQLEYSDVSRYDYEIIFRPEAIIPVTIKTQMGEY